MLEKMIIDTAEKLRFASQSMPKVWDGRESILEMRDTGFEYWRQEEWIEFYFKFLCQKHCYKNSPEIQHAVERLIMDYKELSDQLPGPKKEHLSDD